MQAVIYTRVSSDEQIHGTSLATQEAACRAWCTSHGFDVAALFSDAGESAKTTDRPQFIALLDWVAKHKPAVCVVWKFDRWARNSTDHAIAAQALAKHGTRLVSATEAAADDPAGRLLQTILAGIAQFDNEVRAERTKAAMRAIAMRGGWCSLAPYGFMLARSGTLPILVEHPEHARVVRDLFTGLATRRRNLIQTVTTASEHGIRVGSARKMLRATIYSGVIRNVLTGWQEIEAAFPGLVPRETWQAAQDAITGRRHAPRQAASEVFPLRGVLHCCNCGKLVTACFVRGHGGRYGYYQCKAGHVRGRAETVHESFAQLLVETSDQVRLRLEEIRKRVREIVTERLEASQAVKHDAAAEVDRLSQRRTKLLDVYLAGAVSNADFVQRDAGLSAEIRAAEETSRVKADWSMDVDDRISATVLLLTDPLAIWNRIELPARHRFARALYDDDLSLQSSGEVQTSASAGLAGALQVCSATENAVAPPVHAWANLMAGIAELAAAAA